MKTLTDYEQLGFQQASNLADGHAYQGLSESQLDIVARLSEIWQRSERDSIPDSEQRYLERFARLSRSPGLLSVASSSVLPTASNSIDVIGAYLRGKGSRVLLTHPTFDNLALLLRRRGVEPRPISEASVQYPAALAARLRDADTLFLVNPNNPTGTNLAGGSFAEITDACVRLGVTMIIDASFRLFYPQEYDMYQMLQEAGASYIVFEDTGKVFPTQDMKASILSCSADHQVDLRTIYNEVYLCVSKFSLAVLGEFFEDAQTTGLGGTLHAFVADRRTRLRSAVGEHAIEPIARPSRISVEWLSTAATGQTDSEVVTRLSELGVAVLPGRGFFWNSAGAQETTRNVRVSLMKPQDQFDHGVEIIAKYFAERTLA